LRSRAGTRGTLWWHRSNHAFIQPWMPSDTPSISASLAASGLCLVSQRLSCGMSHISSLLAGPWRTRNCLFQFFMQICPFSVLCIYHDTCQSDFNSVDADSTQVTWDYVAFSFLSLSCFLRTEWASLGRRGLVPNALVTKNSSNGVILSHNESSIFGSLALTSVSVANWKVQSS